MALPGYDTWATTPPDEPETVECHRCHGDCDTHSSVVLGLSLACPWCAWTELSERMAALLDAPHAVTEAEARFLDQHLVDFKALLRDVEIEINKKLSGRGGGRCRCGAQMVGPGRTEAEVGGRTHRLNAKCD